jgi:hypothetical protein
MPSSNKPPQKVIPPRKDNRIVWVACRSKAGCEGKQAQVVWSKKKPGGGSITRYKCRDCGGAFHIQT